VQKFGVGIIRDILIIWVGRNDTALSLETTLANIASMVACVSTEPIYGKRYLVLTILPKTDGTENVGSAERTALDAKSDAIIAAYPNNYVDVRTIPGILLDASRADGLHLTGTYYALVAAAVHDALDAKAW